MNVKISQDFEVRPVPVWDAGKPFGSKPKGYEPMLCKTSPGSIWLDKLNAGQGIVCNAIVTGRYYNTPEDAMAAYANARQLEEGELAAHFRKNI